MDCNNVTVTTTIEHCSTKRGFSSSPPQDLINNNDSSIKQHKSFGSTIISTNTNDLQNNELKIPISSVVSTTTTSDNECSLESSSVPDADLTESLATATEALTEILVKTNVVELNDNQNSDNIIDTNGNELSLLSPKQHPNVSSSYTQTECPPSMGSCHACCCTEWNRWKQLQSAADENKLETCSGSSSSSSSNSSTAAISVQCQSVTSNRCCSHHIHKRKKALNVSSSRCSEIIKDKNINNCDCGTVISSTKYSKSWRELRKSSKIPNKRSSNMICRFQSCNSRSSSKPM